jgi:enoyl-[acyl-carrier protein] reductase II
MSIARAWKQRIVDADATDAVKVSNSERVLPPITLDLPPGPAPAPRALRTPLIDQLASDPGSVDPDEVVPRFVAEARANGGHEQLPFTGQSAALVHDVAPAAEIVARLCEQADAALEWARTGRTERD